MDVANNVNIPTWVHDDLQKSGLSLEDFPVSLLRNENELKEHLGFTIIDGTQILDVGGYLIGYPNKPGYSRLKLKKAIGGIKYLSKKGAGNHPYIPSQVESLLCKYSPDKAVFITEGEKKAAKAALEGFPCIGLIGVWGFKDKESDFLTEFDKYIWKYRKVYIIYDSDIVEKLSVRQAEMRLAIELINRGADVRSIRLPNEPDGTKNGLDDYLVRYGNEKFRELIESARPTLESHIEGKTDFSLMLRELIRLDNEVARVRTIKTLAVREGVNMEAMEAEYKKYLPGDKKEKQSTKEVFTPGQIEKARALLNSTDILSDLLTFTKRQGFTGEEMNQKLLYISFTSRFFIKDSISTIVKGQSSSGKSHLVGIVLNLFPEADVLKFSFLTAKALVHRQGDLNHKILHIAEHSGGEGADYSIRTALSEGEISIMIPEKDEITGKWGTIEKRIPAKGLVFAETTTATRVHCENQTRLFDLYVDESEEQTANILFMQAEQLESQSPEVIEEVKVWRAAQTLLENHRVYIPYARELVKSFPKNKARVRRDFPRLLSLIRTHTLLYQSQRKLDEKGRLIAEVKDFEAVLSLAEKILIQSMKELSPKQEEVLAIIHKYFPDTPFKISEVHKKTGGKPAYSTLQGWFKDFSLDGSLEWNEGKGAASRYTLLTSDKQLGNTPIFTPNLLETLKNNYLVCKTR
ncbi:MAG: DUF3854 domain-containing protein [Thermodesulfobacteriota bacterium]